MPTLFYAVERLNLAPGGLPDGDSAVTPGVWIDVHSTTRCDLRIWGIRTIPGQNRGFVGVRDDLDLAALGRVISEIVCRGDPMGAGGAGRVGDCDTRLVVADP